MGRLKTTDLMAFDLVRHKKTKEVISVFEIDEYRNVINNEADGYCSETNIGIDDVEPIPLTQSILEDNGFVLQDSWYRWRKYDNEIAIKFPYTDSYYQYVEICYTKLCYNPEDVTETEYGMNFVFKNTVNVHELQHVLRLCGLNDLADNPKLEEVK